ncbi:hypothetical protein L226DRAFT_573878 [Lentinus tigrinus ALCF2SS1-7]|uniref:uncharacterized protein n=1 Tax=Lentinus tigrinus ALCF2SS1-7 TaxID=1328758 RepID=UPI0011663A36|nr:hypothetical protein L226DRAFT_573878 [Lentinus tigrinus ALCF2SS1-7]
MTSPRLNWDVLREIARCADRATCTSLILTCRFFYHEAAKTILFEPVLLHNEDHVSKFLRFVQADDNSRYTYVRDVSFDFYELPPQLLDSLVRSMAHMTRLERMYLGMGERFLNIFPVLADAIARLTSLRRLAINYAGDLTCAFLNSLQSGLVSVTLTWIWRFEHEIDPHLLNNQHPAFLLARCASTLEELIYKNWLTSSEVPVFNHSYPKLRTLEMYCDDEFPLVVSYIRAFPNLRRLRVETLHSESDSEVVQASVTERLTRHRERNISSQLDPHGPGTWKHLEEFCGFLVDLYVLGLASRISSVTFLDDLGGAHHLDFLSAVLSYAQPLHLEIHGRSRLLARPTLNLTTILRQSGAARLESLDIAIRLLEKDGTLDIISHLHALASSLSQLPSLRRLRLIVTSAMYPRTLTLPPLAPVEVMLESFDVDAFVRALGEATPSLRDAIVEVVGPRGKDRRRQGVIAKTNVEVARTDVFPG